MKSNTVDFNMRNIHIIGTATLIWFSKNVGPVNMNEMLTFNDLSLSISFSADVSFSVQSVSNLEI